MGVLQVKDLAAAAVRRKIKSIRPLVKQAPAIPESFDALDIVNILKESEVHFGLVYDEYGHFEGIVTTADILEAIVGTFRGGAEGNGTGVCRARRRVLAHCGLGSHRIPAGKTAGCTSRPSPISRPWPAMSSTAWGIFPKSAKSLRTRDTVLKSSILMARGSTRCWPHALRLPPIGRAAERSPLLVQFP